MKRDGCMSIVTVVNVEWRDYVIAAVIFVVVPIAELKRALDAGQEAVCALNA